MRFVIRVEQLGENPFQAVKVLPERQLFHPKTSWSWSPTLERTSAVWSPAKFNQTKKGKNNPITPSRSNYTENAKFLMEKHCSLLGRHHENVLAQLTPLLRHV